MQCCIRVSASNFQVLTRKSDGARALGNISVFWLAQLVCDTKSDRPPCFVLRKGPSMPKTELKHTERGTQHCNNGRPTPVCDPCRPNSKYSLTHSSSMKGPSLNFHAESELENPKTTFFFIISPTTAVRARTSSSCCLSLIKEASYTHKVLRYGTLLL